MGSPTKSTCTVGLLAHVDAGKTTLSEALLYVSGTRRTLGRVDHADAYLDTHVLERQRGITIFSKHFFNRIGICICHKTSEIDFCMQNTCI